MHTDHEEHFMRPPPLTRVTISTLRIIFTEEFLNEYMAHHTQRYMLCEVRGKVIKIKITETPLGGGGSKVEPIPAVENVQR